MLLTLVDGSAGGENSSESLPEIPAKRENPDRSRPKHPRPSASPKRPSAFMTMLRGGGKARAA
jgi:hypothetical protein